MSIAANKRLVRRFYEEVINAGDTSHIAEFIAEDCVEVDGTRRVASGIAGMAEHVRGVRSVYPDLRLRIERQIAEGEWVATQVVATGTHRGRWLDIRPTGQTLEFTGVNVDRVIDDRIAEHGGAANMLQPLLAAGALRAVSE